MLIGSENLDYQVIKNLVGDDRAIVEYSDSLVPKWARHLPCIINNQRYFTALHIRNMLQLPFSDRKRLCNALIKDCSIHGIVNEFVPIQRIFEECDNDLLIKLLRKEYYANK